eukprot:jgi/Tetstr1/425117/TSEL_015579.t1
MTAAGRKAPLVLPPAVLPRATAPARPRYRSWSGACARRLAVALSDADVAAVAAMGFGGAVTGICWWIVSSRVNRTIRARNLRSSVDEKLQAAQLALLQGTDDEAEAAALRRRVAALRVIAAEMEAEADEGRAIQGRARVPELTPLTYVRKSLTSALRDAGRGTPGDPASRRAQSITRGVNLTVILLLLLTAAFLPS